MFITARADFQLQIILLLAHFCVGSQNNQDVANLVFFEVGSFHPSVPETDACKPIRSRIQQNSVRYFSELVMSTNPLIEFESLESQVMSSRLKLKLDNLAELYYEATLNRMEVLKAWTEFPDPDLYGNEHSLHYEGES